MKTRKYPTQNIRILEDEASLRLANYSYLGQTLILSQSALSALIGVLKTKIRSPSRSEGSTIEIGLFCSFVMFYCKMFKSTSARKIKLKCKDLYKVPDDLDIHNEIEDYRNTFFAHSGDYKGESAVCVLVTENDRHLIESYVIFRSLPSIDRLEKYQVHLNIASKWLEMKQGFLIKPFSESKTELAS